MDEIKGIIFDLDGVLVKTQLNFKQISKHIFGKEKFPLLEHILKIEDPLHKKRAFAILEKYENTAALSCKLNEGIPELLEFLDQYGIKRGIVTRNNRKSLQIIIRRFNLKFDAAFTREDTPPKPAKDAVVLACRKMKLSPNQVIFLGDYEFDMIAGKRAGVFTVLLKTHLQSSSQYADLVVESIPHFTCYLKSRLGTNENLTFFDKG